jgi:endogenous inhibitor of DNA gyrase (YacG/DUF329 family)
MVRRKPYTKVEKENRVIADFAKGKGDVVFKVFQCLNYECQQMIIIQKDKLLDNFKIKCPSCGQFHKAGETTKFYDYVLKDKRDNSIIEKGEFTLLHDDYINEAPEYKYCIICSTLKPLDAFDFHSARVSNRQGECRLCKKIYNSIKNQTRITDQHREAAQKRRLYLDISGKTKLNSKKVYEKFSYKCFKCGKDLKEVKHENERPLDHTLPASYFWPLNNDNATLLCRKHNSEKSGKWPSQYYTQKELKRLSAITGFDIKILSGKPTYNPEAIKKLKSPKIVNELLSKYAAYMDEIIKIRNKILKDTGFDFFKVSKAISKTWVEKADSLLKK